MLSFHTSTILNLLIDEYAQTASPVASDGIARSPALRQAQDKRLRVSPATVRSAMSQLTEAGYISRPHVSAGGVPSDLGYRHSDMPEHHVEGLGRLMGQPEFAADECARRLVQAVEERALLERIVTAAREPAPDAPKVYIGSENQDESLRSFGVIVCRYGRPDGVGGAICVVGHTRMGYSRAIAGTRHLANLMGRMAQTLEDGEAAKG